ncbi:hypothetical protein K438DRAFT_152190 [Mycena galopus ATCC 62051]|nr:hypothetical protein K438DRAFT_152190 [Mycena galopus ATCC 62051]
MANIRSRTPIPPHHRPGTAPPIQRDSETPDGSTHRRKRSRGDPWRHMVDTYAWVEHHCSPPIARRKTTEEWVLEQQILCTDSIPRGHRDGFIFIYDDEYRMREQEQLRQQKARIDEKLKDIECRIRRRREMEQERLAAERLRVSEERKEREKVERARANQAMRGEWRRYEKGWEDLLQCPERSISFSTIPWPLASTPSRPRLDEITATDIAFFLLSPLHSEGQTGKERIRRAQLIWHPDRFQKILGRVSATDKAVVETAAGIVARCLNDLMAREAQKARR